MTRRYDETVDVRRHDDVPAQFVWSGRLYLVRDVLSHWVETGAWWSAATGRVAPGAAVVEDGDREFWRVEASAGRAAAAGVYDLAFDWATGCWSLVRALD